MKESIGFLPQQKQDELNSLCELIHRSLKVDIIILFGSHSRNEWQDDVYTEGHITYEYRSDFDILVIVEDKKVAENHSIWGRIESQHDKGYTTPVSIISHDIVFVNRQLKEGRYFFSDIKKGGILLYDSKRFQLAEKSKLSPQQQKKIAQEDFDYWFESAVHFYDDFKSNLKKERYNKAAFMLHQSTENFYHTILLVHTGYKPKVHDIEGLGKKAKAFCLEVCHSFSSKNRRRKTAFLNF